MSKKMGASIVIIDNLFDGKIDGLSIVGSLPSK